MLSKLNSFGLTATSVEVVSEPTVVIASPPPTSYKPPPPPSITVDDFRKALEKRLERRFKCKNVSTVSGINVVSLVLSVLCVMISTGGFVRLMVSTFGGKNDEEMNNKKNSSNAEQFGYTDVRCSRNCGSTTRRAISFRTFA